MYNKILTELGQDYYKENFPINQPGYLEILSVFEKNRKKWEFHTAESSLTTGLIAAAHMEWPGHWKKRLEK